VAQDVTGALLCPRAQGYPVLSARELSCHFFEPISGCGEYDFRDLYQGNSARPEGTKDVTWTGTLRHGRLRLVAIFRRLDEVLQSWQRQWPFLQGVGSRHSLRNRLPHPGPSQQVSFGLLRGCQRRRRGQLAVRSGSRT